jgi:cyclopropane-fatty-acyl-phospholipid synthase
MSVQVAHSFDRTVQAGLDILEELFQDYSPRDFAIRFWDGTTWDAESGQPKRFTLCLNHPGSLCKMFWQPNEVTLGEAYIYNDFDIEGDIGAVFSLADYVTELSTGITRWLKHGAGLLSLIFQGRAREKGRAARLRGEVHTPDRDRSAVTFHYDLSNEFFALWLDTRMVYSSAYFGSESDDLDTAQERKLDYICRKLRLRPGDRLLDIGCGWGGLVIHAAKNYGARALGITLSGPQAGLARERIAGEGLSDRCRVEVLDYRHVEEPESYDKAVSVGMFEHVGQARLPEYFRRAWRLLKPGGTFLNHGIARTMGCWGRKGPSFLDHYVFPDSDLVPLSIALKAAERAGFEVRDVESLREHYALTLQNWVKRLEARHLDACRITDEVTYRIWRLYMSGAAHEFTAGRMNVYQALMVKPDRGRSGLPFTREDWYS